MTFYGVGAGHRGTTPSLKLLMSLCCLVRFLITFLRIVHVYVLL